MHSRPHEAEDLIVRTVQQHGAALLRVARKHSLCVDDAQDAYQRALEIFMRRVDTLDADTAHSWLFIVVRNEALAVREQRSRLVGTDEVSLDLLEAREMPSPEDVVLDVDELTRAAEALTMLKPHEVTALWMRANGRAYKEIASEMDWSYTKVNRCISEGRRAFLEHFVAIDSGAACERWAPSLSAVFDDEASTKERLQLRRHLRNCSGCRATALALHRTRAPLAAVLPGLLLAEPAVAESGNFVLRVYEAAAHFATERAAASTLKVQAIIDTASMTKVTAVAASAAALAGGGAATVKDVVAPGKARAEPTGQSASTKRRTTEAKPIVGLAPVPAPSAAVIRVPRPSGTRAAARRPAAAIVQAGRRERRLKAATARARTRAAARPATPSARATAEFSGLPASSGPAVQRASAGPAPSAAPAPAASFERSSAPAPKSSSTSSAAAAREFAP